MIVNKFKIKAVLQILFIAGTVCAADIPASWQQDISDSMKQIVKKQSPVATEILLFDIQQKKIIVSDCYGKDMPEFAPMSMLKPFVITAALEAGAVTTDDFIDCENGRISVEGRMLLDVYKWQKITVSEILKNSSNIGTWKIAKKLGFSPLEKFLAQIGFKKHLAPKDFGKYLSSCGQLRE